MGQRKRIVNKFRLGLAVDPVQLLVVGHLPLQLFCQLLLLLRESRNSGFSNLRRVGQDGESAEDPGHVLAQVEVLRIEKVSVLVLSRNQDGHKLIILNLHNVNQTNSAMLVLTQTFLMD